MALGAAVWAPWQETVAPVLPMMPLTMAIIVLGQAFPEELLWRGHLQDTLSGRLSPRAVLIIVSVVFGALHILSSSPADTVTERLLYLVTASALGFACAAALVRGGALWMAVGVHTGFHMGHRLLPTQGIEYGVQLVILACTLAVTGFALLAPLGRKGRQAEAQGRIATKSA
ncbi:membrane protease YdiL (CAAX protease family) [Nonomuraea muscovyensis]|uniref:Membrane protease YdiL (CAAX protease family) n=1 Tax=Nonomuraea muscovyensis TaxID=1124761 RepID=A0A7X0C133_9ACTN|nr:CPBP family intramembrane glutamic endopeptidase [Nonomuraea muscovyensis]MBB6346468.1 membrane protease YdiL (CAAX protease family) [Nonomuraea muscovyensis]